jgi:type II secretory ATPase GspE/PulE/Tfp pilus assembly ATPase PilB-like protein
LTQIVDDLVRRGLEDGASDIHVEPHADRLLVRTRVDGFLARARELPLALHGGIVSRIKIMRSVTNRPDTAWSCQDGTPGD